MEIECEIFSSEWLGDAGLGSRRSERTANAERMQEAVSLAAQGSLEELVADCRSVRTAGVSVKMDALVLRDWK